MELQRANAKLQEKRNEIKTLKADFAGIFSALCDTSAELEKANSLLEEQKGVIAALQMENATLRCQLPLGDLEATNSVDAPKHRCFGAVACL